MIDFEGAVSMKQSCNAIYVTFYPDYTKTNPYQRLIGQHLPSNFEYSPGDIDSAIELISAQSEVNSCLHIFHMHWVNPIFSRAATQWQARSLCEKFLHKLRNFISSGGRLIWTIHNWTSHDKRFFEIEKYLYGKLASLSTYILVHAQSTVDAFVSEYNVPLAKLKKLDHPNYIGVYSNNISQAKARGFLDIEPSSIVYGFIGQLRPYKGIDDLVAVSNELLPQNENCELLIAGAPVYPYSAETVSRLVVNLSNVITYERFIPDNQLQYYFNACDFIVLPYKKILTSGSILNALSFGRPVIAPNLGTISEVISENINGWMYNANDLNDLKRTIQRAIDYFASAHDKQEMFRASLDSVKKLTWASYAEKYAALVEEIILPVTIDTQLDIDVKITNREIVRKAPKGKGATVAIVVLLYRNLDDLERLLTSLTKSSFADFELIIVDNCSPGYTISDIQFIFDRFDELAYTCIRTEANYGYAGGNNIGIEYIRNKDFEYVWVLNPDCEVDEMALEELLGVSKNYDDKYVFGSVLVNGHDKETIYFGGADVNFSTGFATKVQYAGIHVSALPDAPYTTDYTCGASIFCRTSVFFEGSLFPEDYFLYFEETDWCMSLKQKGVIFQIVPTSIVYHYKNSESNNLPTLYYFYYYIRNSFLFTSKFAPQMADKTEKNIRYLFLSKWLDKIENRSPEAFEPYKQLGELAIRDGKTLCSGMVDLCQTRARLFDNKSNLTEKDCIGNFERITSEGIVGWACYPVNPGHRVEVFLFVDGDYVTRITADQLREDLLEAHVGDGHHGFALNIPAIVKDAKKHLYEVYAEGGAKLGSLFYRYNKPDYYRGRIDGITDFNVVGWALNDSDITENVYIEIVNKIDQVICVGICDIFRRDLLVNNVGTGKHGFSIRIPSNVCNSDKHALKLRIATTKEVLHERDIVIESSIYTMPDTNLDDQLRLLDKNRIFFLGNNTHGYSIIKYFKSTLKHALHVYSDSQITPLVSVVMPAFNREKTIEKALLSVYNQTYKNIEVIVIDDCSTDNTSNCVKIFSTNHTDLDIRFYRNEKNKGVSVSRNVALSHARGDIIAYLDSDNEWFPEYLTVMTGTLQHGPHRCAYCAQEIIHVIKTDDGEYDDPIAIRGGNFVLSLLQNQNYIDLNCFVHHKSLIDHCGAFSDKLKRLVDWDLILRYCMLSAPKYVPAVLSKYYFDRADNQITHVEKIDYQSHLFKHSLCGLLNQFDECEINNANDIHVFYFLTEEDITFRWDSVSSLFASNGVSKIYFFLLSEQLEIDEIKKFENNNLFGGLFVSESWEELLATVDSVIRSLPSDDYLVFIFQQIILQKMTLHYMRSVFNFDKNIGLVSARQDVKASDTNLKSKTKFFTAHRLIDSDIIFRNLNTGLLQLNHVHFVEHVNLLCNMITTKIAKQIFFSDLNISSARDLVEILSNVLKDIYELKCAKSERAIITCN